MVEPKPSKHDDNELESEKHLLVNSDIILQLGLPSEDNLSLLKENQNLMISSQIQTLRLGDKWCTLSDSNQSP